MKFIVRRKKENFITPKTKRRHKNPNIMRCHIIIATNSVMEEKTNQPRGKNRSQMQKR